MSKPHKEHFNLLFLKSRCCHERNRVHLPHPFGCPGGTGLQTVSQHTGCSSAHVGTWMTGWEQPELDSKLCRTGTESTWHCMAAFLLFSLKNGFVVIERCPLESKKKKHVSEENKYTLAIRSHCWDTLAARARQYIQAMADCWHALVTPHTACIDPTGL